MCICENANISLFIDSIVGEHSKACLFFTLYVMFGCDFVSICLAAQGADTQNRKPCCCLDLLKQIYGNPKRYFTVYFCASIVAHKKTGITLSSWICKGKNTNNWTAFIRYCKIWSADNFCYSLMNFVLIFCCAFRCNISHLLKIVFSFVQYNGIDVNLGADESLLCVLQMTVFYYSISDVSVWSFVVAINKNCKRVSKNNHDLCNISEDLYIISVGDSLRTMLPSDRFGHSMVQWFALVYKVLEGRFVFLNT